MKPLPNCGGIYDGDKEVEDEHKDLGKKAEDMPMGCYPISPYLHQPLLPQNPTQEEILEALQLWCMPEKAYPHDDKLDVNYTLKSKGLPKIHVHLRRQAFVTQPKTQKHSYFSFWATEEFPIGPVDNPMPPGQCVPHRGYNHTSATLAFGEAKLLAGWEQDVFAVEWTLGFADGKQRDQAFPPTLANFIWVNWPSLSVSLKNQIHPPEPDPDDPDPQPDAPDADTQYPKSTSFGFQLEDGVQLQSLQPDLLDTMLLGYDQLNDEVSAGGEESNSSVATFQDQSLSQWHVIGRDYDI